MSTGRTARWRTAVEILGYLRRESRPTRSGLAGALGLSSSSATEVTARLRRARLISEDAVPAAGRGRPTTLLRPHPAGPLVLALELRPDEVRSALVGLDGRLGEVRRHRHGRRSPDDVLAALASTVRGVFSDRLRAVSLAAAATVRDGRLVQASTLGWGPVEVSGLVPDPGLPLLVGNDATLAGVAEARTGAAAGARTALHLLVDVGIGGGLVVDGRPVTGATGAGGEVGHVPFGEASRRCPCGATGCWDLEVDGRALARHLGRDEPADPHRYARAVLARSDPDAGAAVGRVVTALARGTAGLVNLHDPDVVTLGGLAADLRAAAPDRFGTAYAAGLMTFRRDRPPPVRDAVHGDLGALQGAAEVGVDHLTTESALAAWSGA
ncbi:ROK family protein [Cryptosporangium japonicum]|uniref:ROK family transcriptional regulator n=1 Tax=Cryptosporangium japonicum TaxID=80872 RepID=A0ABN0U0W1_9ACTN